MLTEALEMVRIQERPYLIRVYGISEEEYWRITNEDTKYELIDGVLILHSPATTQHEKIFVFLVTVLNAYVQRHRLGEVLGSRATLHLAPGRNLEPDLFFIASRNLALVQHKRVERTADLVIEILSENTREYDLKEKRPLYQEARVGEIWFVDPDRREVLVDRRQDAGYAELRYSEGRLLSSTATGFWLDVSWLWQDPLPDPLACLQQILH